VYWECNQTCSNELYPAGLVCDIRGKDPTDYRNAGKTTLLECIESINRALPHDIPHETRSLLEKARRCWLWATAVGWYMERHLTYPRDVLPALSGIAKHLAPVLGGTAQGYVAGMWRDQCMFAQLGWFTASPSTAPRSTELLGPTWSWVVATDTPVQFAPFLWAIVSWSSRHLDVDWARSVRENPIKTCTVLDAQATLATADPTGAVKDGFVLLQGHLNRLTLGAKQQCFIGGQPVPMDLYLDSALEENTSDQLFLFSLYSVFLALGIEGKQGGIYRPHPTYLVLSPVEERRGTYERRGLAMWQWFGTDVEIEPPWETLSGQGPSEGSFNREVGYSIRVI